jgi:hypothetical protein
MSLTLPAASLARSLSRERPPRCRLSARSRQILPLILVLHPDVLRLLVAAASLSHLPVQPPPLGFPCPVQHRHMFRALFIPVRASSAPPSPPLRRLMKACPWRSHLLRQAIQIGTRPRIIGSSPTPVHMARPRGQTSHHMDPSRTALFNMETCHNSPRSHMRRRGRRRSLLRTGTALSIRTRMEWQLRTIPCLLLPTMGSQPDMTLAPCPGVGCH